MKRDEFQKWFSSLKVGDKVALYRDKERADFLAVHAITGIQNGQITVLRPNSPAFGRSGKSLRDQWHTDDLWIWPVTKEVGDFIEAQNIRKNLRETLALNWLSLPQLKEIMKMVRESNPKLRHGI